MERINEIICGSFEDHKNYFSSHVYDKKNLLKVKIIKNDDKNLDTFEEKINSSLSELSTKYEIVDIKYSESSCLVIYKRTN